jgi:putative ABC transport system permease protein
VTLTTVAVKNIGRNLFRTILTMLGVVVAIMAFLLLRTVISSWMMGIELAAKDRVASRHKVTFIMTLPLRYVEDVRAVPGIKDVAYFNWFGAKLAGKEDQFFGNMATDPASFLRVYDEIVVPEDQKKAWFENRQGALVGATLAKQLGLKVGDKITLKGTIYPGDWPMTVEGIYSTTRKSIDQSTLWFHWKYLNESPVITPPMKDQVGWITSKINKSETAADVTKRIDAMFDTRDVQTLSMDEGSMNASFMSMFATLLKAIDLVSIVVLIIMMLILGNTIAMGTRERTHEYGVLRAIGFMPKHLAFFVLGEAAVIGLIGGALGVGFAYFLVNNGLGQVIEEGSGGMFLYFRMKESHALAGLVIATLAAATAAAIPAYRASKLDVIDALRRVG